MQPDLLQTEIAFGPAGNFRDLFQAFRLVHDEYCRHGFMIRHSCGLRYFVRELLPDSNTFVAKHQNEVVGSLTGILLHNNPESLGHYARSKRVLDLLHSGKRVGEATKFAFKRIRHPRTSSEVSRFASFTLIKYIVYWMRLNGVDEWIITVNPKHRAFYENYLGLEAIDEIEECHLVQKLPGVVLRMNIEAAFEGTWPLREAGQKLFFDSPLTSEEVERRYYPQDFEIALLLLEQPELFVNSAHSELQQLYQLFPRVFGAIDHLLIDNLLRRSTPSGSPIEAFKDLLCLSTESETSLPVFSPTCFQLRTYLTRVCAVLELFLLRNRMSLSCAVSDYVWDSVIGDPSLLGRLLVSLIAEAQKENTSDLIMVRVESEGTGGDEVDLKVAIQGIAGAVPQAPFQTLLASANGTLTKLKRDDDSLAYEISLPMMLFEKSINYGLYRQANLIKPTSWSEQAQAEAGPQSLPPLSQLNVLLIEDNLINQTILAQLLQRHGHSVRILQNGDGAAELIEKVHFDVVLMDCQLPGLDGFTATKQIRAFEQQLGLERIPIIAVTAFVMKGDRERCLEAGMDGYVTKPVNVQTLFATIRKVLHSGQPNDHTATTRFLKGSEDEGYNRL